MSTKTFKRYLNWQQADRDDIIHLRTWLLERLPHEIVVHENDSMNVLHDLTDVDDLTTGQWSAYADGSLGARYFFELESDAVAFKLRWC